MSDHSTNPQTVICMKWGRRYPADFVNRLHGMVMRNTNRPTRLVCYTDDPTDLHPDIVHYPLPPIELPDTMAWTPWRKISLWQESLQGIEGDVLFLDLDVVVTGNLDRLFDYEPGKFAVILNWTQAARGVANTSVFRFHIGMAPEIFHRVVNDPLGTWKIHQNEQDVIAEMIPDKVFWPEPWVVSFKHSLMPKWPMNFFLTPTLPQSAKIVVFTGKPDPDEALVGVYPVKHPIKRLYKYVRPTPWIGEHWRA